MKGIIVEASKIDAVVLLEDGTFQKVKNNRYEVGQQITLKLRKKVSRFVAGAASFAAAVAVFTIGTFAYFTPTDYVSLDVNPSIEYSLNRFDRILKAEAVNDDGEKILSQLEVKHMTVEKGVKKTLDLLIEEGYLTDDENSGVVITTSNSDMDEAEKLAEELKEKIQGYLDDKADIHATIEAEAVGKARVQEAKALGVTPGKLNLVEKLKASAEGQSEIDMDEWLTKSVKDINKAIKENKIKNKDLKDDSEGIEDQENTVVQPGKSQETNARIKDRNTEKSSLKDEPSLENEETDTDTEDDSDKDKLEEEKKMKELEKTENENRQTNKPEKVKQNSGKSDKN